MSGPAGEKNGRWKGNSAGVVAVHHWVKRRKQKTGRCSECDEERYTEWANVDHKYLRNLDDYIELCKPCHIAHDEKNGLVSPRRGRPAWNRGAKCAPGCGCGHHTRYTRLR